MAYSVFLSSTRLDLEPHRRATADLLRRDRFQVIETIGARVEEPVEACIRDIGEADFFVGVYAWRYGHVPERSLVSITESELLAAEAMVKPILCFIAADSIKASFSPESLANGEDADRLNALKDRVKLRHTVETFTDPTDLAGKVVVALHRLTKIPFTPARRLLMDLWGAVQSDWLGGVLWPTVEGRWIEIDREECPQAVERPAPAVALAAKPLAPHVVEPLHGFFERSGRRLLILGASGAGKTIALLELAQQLGRLAMASSERPVPVVFNLASWRWAAFNLPPWLGGLGRLANWMVSELDIQYRVKRGKAKEWIKEKAILPLLDGLDEVAADLRDDCVDAINAYLDDLGLEARVAVCCRTDVYKYEELLLCLDSALLFKPLTEAQVNSHLAGGGPKLAGLQAAIDGSPELREVASSPLFLGLLEWMYCGAKLEEIRVRNAEEVLAEYVTKALEPRYPSPLPARRPVRINSWLTKRLRRPRRVRQEPARQRRRRIQETRRVLSWLARRMAEHNPSLFQIERLQPSWLASGAEVRAYALASRAIGGALIALPLAWFYSSLPLVWVLFLGLLAGALAGGVDAVTLQRSRQRGSASRRSLGYPIVGGLLVFVGIAVLLLFAQFLGGEQLTGLGPTNRGFLIATVLLAGWIGIGFGSRGARRDARHDVHVAESLKWERWSWRGAGLGAFWGGFVGVVLSALALMSPTLRALGVWKWSQLIAYLVGLGGLLGGMVGRIGKRRLERNVWPNQGTWRGLGNTAVLTLGAGGVMALALALLIAVDLSQGQPVDWQDVSIAMGVSLAFGFWIGLLFGGLDFVQHFTLRAILRLKGRFPPGLVRFLDDAIDRRLLQQVGGSYKFYHPQLLRYFAESEDGSRDR